MKPNHAHMLNVFADLKSLKEELAQYFRHHQIRYTEESLNRELQDLKEHWATHRSILRYLEDLIPRLKSRPKEYIKREPDDRSERNRINSPSFLAKYQKINDAIALLKSFDNPAPLQIWDFQTNQPLFFSRLKYASEQLNTRSSALLITARKKTIMNKRYVIVYNSPRKKI